MTQLNLSAYIARWQARGVTFKVDGDSIKIRPRSALGSKELDFIKRNKKSFITTLNAPSLHQGDKANSKRARLTAHNSSRPTDRESDTGTKRQLWNEYRAIHRKNVAIVERLSPAHERELERRRLRDVRIRTAPQAELPDYMTNPENYI